MGRGQVVRQRVLVPSFGGSNPSVPAKLFIREKTSCEVFLFLPNLNAPDSQLEYAYGLYDILQAKET